jgi:hypothetical protein
VRHVLIILSAGLMGVVAVFGQSEPTVTVCDLTNTLNVEDCYNLDTSAIGGLKIEDYKVINSSAIQFDPAVRLQELSALGTADSDALCETPPAFIGAPPTITFDPTSVKAQIYENTTGIGPLEFVDAEFNNFTASNGYSSPTFGVRMTRQYSGSGEAQVYQIQIQVGNPGLQNVPDIPGGVGFSIDPVGMTATQIGTLSSSPSLNQAMLGVFANAGSIMSAATFTSTPPADGMYLWNGPEITSLATQAEPWIAAAQANLIPLGPPISCVPNPPLYATCVGLNEITAFADMVVSFGGEYLGLHTTRSFNVLVNNLRAWATANAPSFAPTFTGSQNRPSVMLDVVSALSVLWPTLRLDPALASSD